MTEKLIHKIKVFWCFIVGHNMVNLYTLNNQDMFDGVWRSSWGVHKCMRCGKEEHWQWDRP